MNYKDYQSLYLDIVEAYQTKLETLSDVDLKKYDLFDNMERKLYKFLNPSMSSLKKLLSSESHIAFCYILPIEKIGFYRGVREKIYKHNVIFSPLSKFNRNPVLLSNIADNIYKYFFFNDNSDIKRMTYVKEKTKLFSKEEFLKYYPLENYDFISDLVFAQSVFYNDAYLPKIAKKQLFIPILFNKEISDQVIFLPYDFYPEKLKEDLCNEDKELIIYNVEEIYS